MSPIDKHSLHHALEIASSAYMCVYRCDAFLIHDNYHRFIHFIAYHAPNFGGGPFGGRTLPRGGYAMLCHSSPSNCVGGVASVNIFWVARKRVVLYFAALLLQTKVESFKRSSLSSRAASPAVFSDLFTTFIKLRHFPPLV
jgi:hypothetical protein